MLKGITKLGKSLVIPDFSLNFALVNNIKQLNYEYKKLHYPKSPQRGHRKVKVEVQ